MSFHHSCEHARNIIWLSVSGKDSLANFITNLFALGEPKYIAIVSLANIYCQRNIARGNLA